MCSYMCIHNQGCPLTQGWHLLLMFLCLCLEYNLKVTLAEDNFGLWLETRLRKPGAWLGNGEGRITHPHPKPDGKPCSGI